VTSEKPDDQGQTSIAYLDVLEEYLDATNISKESVCLVGSSILASESLRNNEDLDVAIDPHSRTSIDTDETPDNIEIAIERYSWLGVTDADLIHDGRYHLRTSRFNIVRPEIEMSFKIRRHWEKDINDVELIHQYYIKGNEYDWNWDLFDYEYYPSWRNRRGLPAVPPCPELSLPGKFIRKVDEEGFITGIREAFRFIWKSTLGIGDDTSGKPQMTDSGQSVYFIIWPTVSEFYDSITTQLNHELGVLATERIDLGEDISEFVNGIYDFDDDRELIEFKAYRIGQAGSEILVLETKRPVNESGGYAAKFISELKDEIRKQYYPYVADDSYHNILHGPDTSEENEWIEGVVSKYVD